MAAEAAEPSSSYTPVCGTSSETLLDSPTNSSLSDVSMTLGSPPSSPSVSNGHLAGATLQQHPGPKFKLITEGDLQLCRLNHTRTIVSKIMNSKYLRRWESHHVILGENEIYSTTPLGFMETTIPYSSIEEVNVVSRWDAGQKFCLRITVPDGSVLFQANNSYLRDQWMHSLQWKRHVLKYTKLLKNTRRPEVLLKEIKSMIDLSMSTPIQDENVSQFPLDLVSQLLQENEECISQVSHEQVIMALAPLLENNQPTQGICDFFSKHCKNSPRSQIVIELFTPVVHRILKHNTLNHTWQSVAMQGLIQSTPLKYIHKSVEEARALMEKVWQGMWSRA